jgi:hypothetical protein
MTFFTTATLILSFNFLAQRLTPKPSSSHESFGKYYTCKCESLVPLTQLDFFLILFFLSTSPKHKKKIIAKGRRERGRRRVREREKDSKSDYKS